MIFHETLVSSGGNFTTLLEAIPFSYMALFPVLNPLGSALIFLTMTMGTPDPIVGSLCRRIAVNTFVLLLVVLLVGTYILQFFGITIPIVQLGGGIVVAYIGWRLLNQASDTISGSQQTTGGDGYKKNVMEMAFYPLTMPITAGPGCMAVTLTIGAHETISHSFRDTLFGQVGAILGILLCALTVYLCYRYAQRITQRLGSNGTRVIMRLSAFINFCIGLEIAWHGVRTLLSSL